MGFSINAVSGLLVKFTDKSIVEDIAILLYFREEDSEVKNSYFKTFFF